jgi:hypothetical protein
LFPGTNRLHVVSREQFPHPTGYIGDSTPISDVVSTVTGDHKYVYGGFPLIQYISSAFAGRRGGIRYLLDCNGTNNTQFMNTTWTVTRRPNAEISNVTTLIAEGPNVGQSGSQIQRILSLADCDGMAGLAKWCPRLNTTFSFELPYYSRRRFDYAKAFTKFVPRPIDSNGWALVGFDQNDRQTYINSYVAAAEDFTCFFYLGPPRFYVEGLDPPSPVV